MGQEAQAAVGPRLLPDETVLYEVDALALDLRYHVRSEKAYEGLDGWRCYMQPAGGVCLTGQRLIATLSFPNTPSRHFSCQRVTGLLETLPSRRTEYSLLGKPKTTDTNHQATLLLAGGLALDITLPYPEKPDATSHAAFLARSERLSLLLATALLRLGGRDDDPVLIAAAETEAIARRRRQD